MKKTYLNRLAFWARWKLPPQEAESVIADYREMVGTPPRPEEELLRDLGAPQRAVQLLTEPKAYRKWLAVFFLLSLCAVLLCSEFTMYGIFFLYDAEPVSPVLAAAGAVGALLWFRRNGQRMRQMPRGLCAALTALTLWCAGVIAFSWLWMHDVEGFVRATKSLAESVGPLMANIYRLSAAAAALAGIRSLVKARTQDRRWAAVYILALAAALLSMEPRILFFTLSDPASVAVAAFWRRHIAVFLVSLVGAGAALC